MNKEIPVFFAIDNAYIPFFAVTLQSVIENSSEAYNYIINILHTNVNKENIKINRKEISWEFYVISELQDLSLLS